MTAQALYSRAKPGYTDLFNLRGQPYDRAMRLYPQARREEFEQAVRRADLSAGMLVADVPAGGGYLSAYLPSDCHWLGHEPCGGFAQDGSPQQHAVLLPLPWADSSVDAAISIAGLHHLTSKQPLFNELARVVKPGGRVVLADVWTDSAEARFLDDFVGGHNSTGHEGIYLDNSTISTLIDGGWCLQAVEQVAYHWRFRDSAALGHFCHCLFDLRDISPALVAEAAAAMLGVDELPEGVGLRWSLCYIVAQRNWN